MKSFFKKPAVRTIMHLSALAVCMNIIRLVMAENNAYVWLNWNLFLALSPVLFAYLSATTNYRFVSIMAAAVWLAFLPNAPYLVTDFIHLADVGPRALLWYDAIMMFVYSVVGVLAYLVSLKTIVQKFRWRIYMPLIVAILTGFGIYLGRYIRFNTWHVLTQPQDIAQVLGDIIVNPGSHTPVFSITLSFALFLSVLYFTSSSYILHEKTID